MSRKMQTAIWILLIIAVCLSLTPTVTDTYSDIVQISVISGNANTFDSMTEEEVRKEKADALAYNARLAQEQLTTPFAYQGQEVSSAEYESLLSQGTERTDNVMAYIDIPSIDVYLPIAHGTSDDVLAFEAGHMYGSSLPIGGEASNAIIAAHTGLPTARLFSDVKNLENGAEIFITVLDEIHAYEVVKKNIVPMGPEEQQYLQIEGKEDTITLYTCAPYGVNTERVIVRASRNPAKDRKRDGDAEGRIIKSKNKSAQVKLILLLSIPIILIIIWIVSEITNRKKQLSQRE